MLKHVHIYSYQNSEDFTLEEDFKEYQDDEFRDIIESIVNNQATSEYIQHR